MKLNLGAGAHPLDGFDNLDKQTGWTFESGLGQYSDESVDGITISHALMYVPLELWPAVFSEFARVLEPGGVIRITEDATDDPRSERYGGFEGAVTLTSYVRVRSHLLRAGISPFMVRPNATLFRDDSLIQNWHGAPPKIFVVEGLKE